MSDSAKKSATAPDTSELSSRRQQLHYLRQELLKYRPDIVNDDDLREAVTDWLVRASDVPTSTAREYVSSELSDLRRNNEMLMKPGIRDPTNAFPDECKGCDHYGEACPIMIDAAQKERRKRIMEESKDPDELRYLLREYAVDNGCEVLMDRLEKIRQDYGPLLREGQLLLMRVEDEVLLNAESESVARAMANEEALAGAVSEEKLRELKDNGAANGGDD